MPPPGSTPPVPQRNWWQRNWKWCLPAGCLGFVVVGLGAVAVVVFSVFSMLRGSDVHRQALEAAREHPEVVERIGSPIEGGRFPSGSINIENGRGEADLRIPVSGPSGSGTLLAEATRSAGAWTFSVLEFEDAATGDRIDLLAGAGPPSAAPADPPEAEAEAGTGPATGGGPGFRDFRFALEGADGELTEVPNRFRPGDDFVLVFAEVGPFEPDGEGYSRLEVSLEIRDPDRRTVLEQPELFGDRGRMQLRDGIAPSILVDVSTGVEWPPAEYTVRVIIHDLVTGTHTVRNTVFTLE